MDAGAADVIKAAAVARRSASDDADAAGQGQDSHVDFCHAAVSAHSTQHRTQLIVRDNDGTAERLALDLAPFQGVKPARLALALIAALDWCFLSGELITASLHVLRLLTF